MVKPGRIDPSEDRWNKRSVVERRTLLLELGYKYLAADYYSNMSWVDLEADMRQELGRFL